MARVFLHDARVEGATPECDIPFQINPSDDLTDVLLIIANRMNSESPQTAWYHELHLLCHGSPDGLLLGNLTVSQRSVGVFSVLRNRFGSIVIHGCRAAFSYNRGPRPLGGYDGQLFCSLLATTARAFVTASDAVQYYTSSSSIRNLSNANQLYRWQGNIDTWNAEGRMTNVSTSESREF